MDELAGYGSADFDAGVELNRRLLLESVVVLFDVAELLGLEMLLGLVMLLGLEVPFEVVAEEPP